MWLAMTFARVTATACRTLKNGLGDSGEICSWLLPRRSAASGLPQDVAGIERLAYLQTLIRECQIQGVVYHALKFCDASLYDYALLAAIVDAGIPVLYLETEYRDVGLEQARTASRLL